MLRSHVHLPALVTLTSSVSLCSNRVVRFASTASVDANAVPSASTVPDLGGMFPKMRERKKSAEAYGEVHDPVIESGAAPEKRESRRRFSKESRQGRSTFVTKLIEKLKQRPSSDAERSAKFDSLHPRLKLDIIRRAYIKRRALELARRTQHLPRYYSHVFEKKYFFREEDLAEESTKGRGPGGQATNRRMQTCILQHKPTGIVVRHSRWPSLWLNRRAARELLNLRLEERLIGRQSTLGIQKSARESRLKREKKTTKRLVRKGCANMQLERRVPNFDAMLTGSEPFPTFICSVFRTLCGLDDSAQPHSSFHRLATVRCLFNDQCHLWWPLIEYLARTNRLDDLLQCIFPIVPSASGFDKFGVKNYAATCDERAAYEKLVRCRADAEAMANVRRAVGCVLELFGLHMSELSGVVSTSATPSARFAVVKDGPQWKACRHRFERPRIVATVGEATHGAELTPLARKLIGHIFLALLQLGARGEAAALKRLFLQESKTSPLVSWGEEGLSLLQDRLDEFKGVFVSP